MNKIYAQLLAVFVLCATPLTAKTQAPTFARNFHLGFGISPVFLHLSSQDRSAISAGGGGFNSEISFHFEQFALGIKSIAALGIDVKQTDTSPINFTRSMQYVSFTPYVQYTFSSETSEYGRPFFLLGPTSSLTSFLYSNRQINDGKVFDSKVTSKGRGYELSVGWLKKQAENRLLHYLTLTYQNITPEGQEIVDLDNIDEGGIPSGNLSRNLKRVQLLSLNFGAYIF